MRADPKQTAWHACISSDPSAAETPATIGVETVLPRRRPQTGLRAWRLRRRGVGGREIQQVRDPRNARNRGSSDPKRAGLSLLEALFAVALATVFLGGLAHAMQRGLALVRENTTAGDVNARTGRAIRRIVKEILPTDAGAFVPDLLPPQVGPNLGSSVVTYSCPVGFANGAVQWTPPRTIQWEIAPGELDNGLDDDGDGRVDEGSAVLVRNVGQADEQRVVLVNDVREYFEGETPNGQDDNGNGLVDERGLCFDRAGDVVNVRLTLERTGPDGRAVARSQQTSLTTRNQ